MLNSRVDVLTSDVGPDISHFYVTASYSWRTSRVICKPFAHLAGHTSQTSSSLPQPGLGPRRDPDTAHRVRSPYSTLPVRAPQNRRDLDRIYVVERLFRFNKVAERYETNR